MDRRQLLELIEKYLAGRINKEEERQLLHWYHTSDYRRVEWPAANPGEEEEVRLRILTNLQPIYQQQPKSRLRRLVRISAAAAIAGITLLLILIKNRASIEYVSIYNPPGKLKQVQLPDGTQIWLNANTRLRYPAIFVKNREISLDGEAFFQVAAAKEPFIVHTQKLETRVLGTSFDVSAYPTGNKTTISLLTGKVAVNVTGKSVSNVLLPGQQLTLDLASDQLMLAKTSGDANSWQTGELVFDQATLEDITQRLSNWYGYRFHLSDPVLKNYQYTARFKNSIPLKNLLSILSDVNNLRFSIDETRHVVELSSPPRQ